MKECERRIGRTEERVLKDRKILAVAPAMCSCGRDLTKADLKYLRA
jgi:hypothetical protein